MLIITAPNILESVHCDVLDYFTSVYARKVASQKHICFSRHGSPTSNNSDNCHIRYVRYVSTALLCAWLKIYFYIINSDYRNAISTTCWSNFPIHASSWSRCQRVVDKILDLDCCNYALCDWNNWRQNDRLPYCIHGAFLGIHSHVQGTVLSMEGKLLFHNHRIIEPFFKPEKKKCGFLF